MKDSLSIHLMELGISIIAIPNYQNNSPHLILTNKIKYLYKNRLDMETNSSNRDLLQEIIEDRFS